MSSARATGRSENEARIDLLDTIVDESGAHFETAGSPAEGRVTFVSMKMPEHILIGGQRPRGPVPDHINSHDGSSASVHLQPHPCRLREHAQRGAPQHKVHLRDPPHLRCTQPGPETRDALGLTFRYMQDFEVEANKMIGVNHGRSVGPVRPGPLPGAERDKVDELPKGTRIALAQMRSLWENTITLDGMRDTRWGMYNVVSESLTTSPPIRVAGDKAAARALRATTHKHGVSQGPRLRARDGLRLPQDVTPAPRCQGVAYVRSSLGDDRLTLALRIPLALTPHPLLIRAVASKVLGVLTVIGLAPRSMDPVVFRGELVVLGALIRRCMGAAEFRPAGVDPGRLLPQTLRFSKDVRNRLQGGERGRHPACWIRHSGPARTQPFPVRKHGPSPMVHSLRS